jgi:hypothetical protein
LTDFFFLFFFFFFFFFFFSVLLKSCSTHTVNANCPDIGLAFDKIPRLVCTPEGNIVQVAVFGGESTLVGTLPNSIAQLTALTWLEIFGSRGIGGTIPAAAIGALTNLEYLDLMGNSLQGTIGPEISRATNLAELYVASNRLVGTIPQALATLPLEWVWFFENRLVGPVPTFTVAENCTAMGSQEPDVRPDFNCFSECSAACCAKNSTRCTFTGALEPTQLFRTSTVTTTSTLRPNTNTLYTNAPTVPPPVVTKPPAVTRTPPILVPVSPAPPAGKTIAPMNNGGEEDGGSSGSLLGLWIFLGVCGALTLIGLILFCYIRRTTERDYPRQERPRGPSVASVVFATDTIAPRAAELPQPPRGVPQYDDTRFQPQAAQPGVIYDDIHTSQLLNTDGRMVQPSHYSDVPHHQNIGIQNEMYNDPMMADM